MSEGIRKEIEAIQDKEKEMCETKYKIIKDFAKKYPNDAELGKCVRAFLLKQKLKKKRI